MLCKFRVGPAGFAEEKLAVEYGFGPRPACGKTAPVAMFGLTLRCDVDHIGSSLRRPKLVEISDISGVQEGTG